MVFLKKQFEERGVEYGLEWKENHGKKYEKNNRFAHPFISDGTFCLSQREYDVE